MGIAASIDPSFRHRSGKINAVLKPPYSLVKVNNFFAHISAYGTIPKKGNEHLAVHRLFNQLLISQLKYVNMFCFCHYSF